MYPAKDTQEQYSKRVKGLLKPEDWNHFRVVARGSQVRTYLNGSLVAEIHETRNLAGYFGIQHHGKGGTVRFRKIRARRLYPNILWITAEDMSPYLGCYGDTFATTPHLDRFAEESVRYTRAFFRIEGHRHLRHRTVYTADGHPGAAYWDPPGRWRSSPP